MDNLWIEGDYGAFQALDNGDSVLVIVGHKAYTDEQESIELTEDDVIKLKGYLNDWLDKDIIHLSDLE